MSRSETSETISINQDRNLGSNSWENDIFDLTTTKPFGEAELLGMHEKFVRSGYVKIPKYLSSSALTLLQCELVRLEKNAILRNFEMPGYQTPRNLSVVGGDLIKSQSSILYHLYHHYSLRKSIESIIGRQIHNCLHPQEFMVANFLQRSGDTHGWHLDDPAYALIIIAEAPHAGRGGEVEFIPNWIDLCRRKNCKPDKDIFKLINWADENGFIERCHHEEGDAYLLRADLNLHRVAPIKGKNERRSVLNLAFQSSKNMQYCNTADLLYGTPCIEESPYETVIS